MKKSASFEQQYAESRNKPRITIEIPPLILPQPHFEKRNPKEDAAAFRQWATTVDNEVRLTVLALADANGADPDELMKVAPWLVELVPPRPPRGRPRVAPLHLLLRVAQKMGRRTSQKAACDMAEVHPDTFRKARVLFPWAWEMFQEAVAHRRKHGKPDIVPE